MPLESMHEKKIDKIPNFNRLKRDDPQVWTKKFRETRDRY